MTTFTTLIRLLGSAALIATLSACTTTAVKPPPAAMPKLQDMLTKASEAASAGQKENAVKLWKEAAAADPSDKTPYANIAKSKFDAAQYGEAIVNAQEVLVRDPNDKTASSIIATSGLRLATRALSDLSRQNGISGSLQKESMELAKLLRESLGRDELFLPPTKIKLEDKDREKVTKVNPPPATRVRKDPPAAPKPAAEDCKGDPFCVLNK